MYDLIVKPLEFYYGLWPNYAGAIALLTLTIMIILLPLTLKGTRSMLAMQKLQPQMKAIQAKHRDDRQKMNEEMLKFYQENKINPMAGCLPLLLQMPVFFILYSTINGLVHRASFGTDMGAASAYAVNGTDGGVYGNFGNFDPKYLDHASSLYEDLHATREMRSFGLDLAESATRPSARASPTPSPTCCSCLPSRVPATTSSARSPAARRTAPTTTRCRSSSRCS